MKRNSYRPSKELSIGAHMTSQGAHRSFSCDKVSVSWLFTLLLFGLLRGTYGRVYILVLVPTAAVADPESPHSYAAQCGLCGMQVRQDFEAETSKLAIVGVVRPVDSTSTRLIL